MARTKVQYLVRELVDMLMGDSEDLVKINEEFVGRGRWQVGYEVVFLDKRMNPSEGLFQVHYSDGATEYQEMTWEEQFDAGVDGLVACWPVRSERVEVVRWVDDLGG